MGGGGVNLGEGGMVLTVDDEGVREGGDVWDKGSDRVMLLGVFGAGVSSSLSPYEGTSCAS